MMMAAVTRFHVMMIVVRSPFADHPAVFIGVNLTVMMIVVDDIGIMITVDARDAVVVLVMFCARGGAGQNKSTGCQSTKDYLLHKRLGGVRREIIQSLPPLSHPNRSALSRSAFTITETELKLIAAPAIIGLSRMPKNG